MIKIMKSYTDITQSKKLAEILQPESADMFLALDGTLPVMSKYIDDEFGMPITTDPLGDLLRNKEMQWHDDDWCEDVD